MPANKYNFPVSLNFTTSILTPFTLYPSRTNKGTGSGEPCDASALLPNAEGIGDCSSNLASGTQCTNTNLATDPSHHCSPSFCWNGDLNVGHCPASCDASKLILNAADTGDCLAVLPSGEFCSQGPRPGWKVCSPSYCSDGILTEGVCEASCDASTLLPNATSVGDCSSDLMSGESCNQVGVVGMDTCSASHCWNGILTEGICEASCDASELLPNATSLGDCSSNLPSGARCSNVGSGDLVCSESICSDGLLTPGKCGKGTSCVHCLHIIV